MIVAPEEIEFGAYLDKMMKSRSVSGETIYLTRKLWEIIRSLDGEFPEPSASPFERKMCLAWNRNEHHLHVEIRPDCLLDWFYFNYESGDSYSQDGLAASSVPVVISNRLHLFSSEVRA